MPEAAGSTSFRAFHTMGPKETATVIVRNIVLITSTQSPGPSRIRTMFTHVQRLADHAGDIRRPGAFCPVTNIGFEMDSPDGSAWQHSTTFCAMPEADLDRWCWTSFWALGPRAGVPLCEDPQQPTK